MVDPTLRLQVRTQDEVGGASRGVVRTSAATMAALGLSDGDVVRLAVPPPGTATTGAVVRPAPPGTHPYLLLAGTGTVATLGVADGDDVDVGPAPRAAARRVLLRPPYRVATATPDAVRLALLGRVLSAGDEVDVGARALPPLPGDLAVVGRGVERLLRAVARETVAGAHEGWRVLATDPAGPVLVSMDTVVAFESGAQTTTSATPPLGLDLASVAAGTGPVTGEAAAGGDAPAPVETTPPPPGLDAEVRALTEWLDLDFHHQDLLGRLGSGRRLGVLVTGPAGAGKVSLVRAAAAAVGARCVAVWGPQVAGAPDAAARLREAGERAAAAGPGVLLVEDVDALVGTSRPSGQEGALLAELRARVADPRIAVVCTTSRPDECDPRLREPGALDREIAVPLFSRDQRRTALAELVRSVPLAPDVDLDVVAGRTPGFVLADLVSLVHEAGVRAAARHRASLPEGDGPAAAPPAPGPATPGSPEPQGPDGTADPGVVVTAADVEGALGVVRPSAAEGESLEVPDLTLDDVGDMEPVKAALTEAVLWPLTYPDTFSRLGVDPPRGVLLYGPPGCGKTFLVRALAGSGQVTTFALKGAEVLSKWVGESERGVREVFRRARQAAPALVFLDEIDSLAPQRGQGSDSGVSDRVVAALLTELDGIEAMHGVSVVGATNRPDLIDSAVLRPGRLERLVFVPPPDAAARAAILRSAARRSPLAAEVDLDEVARRCEGFSAADCAALVREAALTAMRRSMTSAEVTAADVEAALGVVRPSLDPLQVAALEAFAASRTA